MAGAASRREGNYTDIGVAGRKTGLAITNVARDDDGMEDMDAFFSPDKSMHHTTATDFPASDTNASASMDLVHSSSSGGANLLNALSAHRNPSYRQYSLPPARRSPSRISVSGTPRRASSVAPGSSPARRLGSPAKPTPSRKLDFGEKRVVLSPSRPAVNGVAKRPEGFFGGSLNGSSLSSSSPPQMKQKNGGAMPGKRGLEKIKDAEEEESRIEIPPTQTQRQIPSTETQKPASSPAAARPLMDPKKNQKKRGLLASKKSTKAFSFSLDDEDSEEDEAGQQIQEESLLDSMAQENSLRNVDEDEEMPDASLEPEEEEEEEREPTPVKKIKTAAKKGKDTEKVKPKEKSAPKQPPKKVAAETKTTKTIIPETDDVEASDEEEDMVVPSSPPVHANAPVKGKAAKAVAPPPKKKGKKAKPAPVEEDEDAEEEEEEEELEPPKKQSKVTAKSRTKKAAPVQESEKEDEEPEALPPSKKPTKIQKATKKKPSKSKPVPEPEESEEEEEAPPKRRTKSRAKSPIPTKPTKKPTSKFRKSSSSSSTPKDDELAMAAAEPSALSPKFTRTTKSSKPPAASQPSPSISTRPPRNSRATSVDIINRQRIIHEPPPPTRSPSTDANGIRRSSRARVAPLQFWKNEKIRYALQRREFGPAMPAIQEIIRVESDSEEERKRMSRKRARKPATKGEEEKSGTKKRKKTAVKDEGTKKEEEEDDEAELNPGNPEPWERFTDDTGAVGIKLGDVRPHPSMQTDNADNETMETEIAYSAERILTADVAMGSFRFVKTVTRAGFGTGVLTFRHKEEKRPKNSGTMFLVFYVVAGRASVRIADTQFRIGRGGQFMVPPGNIYSISNEFEPELKLFFAQHAEVEPFDLDDEE